jgi:hypothetical protein
MRIRLDGETTASVSLWIEIDDEDSEASLS